MITDLRKSGYNYDGERGLPEHYPTPDIGIDGLFYIQVNQNYNTVIYEINRNHDGSINESEPLHVYWIKYTENGIRKELNVIQKQLAYGYRHKKICNHSYEISVVSYSERKIYIDERAPGGPAAIMKINNKMAVISNIYVYALEMGLFPDGKYIELYGYGIESKQPVYEKIIL